MLTVGFYISFSDPSVYSVRIPPEPSPDCQFWDTVSGTAILDILGVPFGSSSYIVGTNTTNLLTVDEALLHTDFLYAI